MRPVIVFPIVSVMMLGSARAETHHEISAELDPPTHTIEVTDVVTLSAADPGETVSFLLARQLDVIDVSSLAPVRWRIDRNPDPADFYPDPDSADIEVVGRAQSIVIESEAGSWPRTCTFEIRYRGVIYDTLRAPSKAYSKGFATTTGLVDTAGVFLTGESLWLPTVPEDLFTFGLTVRTPSGWECISQGQRLERQPAAEGVLTTWHCPYPMEECYLVAGPYRIESRSFGSVEASTYLYEPDPDLSDRYLSATGGYLEMYEDLIGPYPYAKFALVENFWQTGYGMPSFTLLGSRVIRLPFIVHTSYGHEILHNWWGNGVYVDEDLGNWCEGLTVYGADYLYKERAGAEEARQYRLETLAGYLNTVRSEDEIPLSEFRERHSASTQAVGYGKAMMVFHMLRRSLGDKVFWRSLRGFYRKHRFRRASWEDLRNAFEETSGQNLRTYFKTWVQSIGAPKITIGSTWTIRTRPGYGFGATIRQHPSVYGLEIPLLLKTAESETTWTVSLWDTLTSVQVEVSSRPVHFAVDPEFDVFRLIDRGEIPPTIGEMLGADTTVVVLGDDPDPGYAAFAKEWAARGGVGIAGRVPAPGELPTSGALILLGVPLPPPAPGLETSKTEWVLEGERIPKENRTLVVTVRDPDPAESGRSYTWVETEDPATLAGIVRKLPHYGRYSYLVFEMGTLRVVEKGIWTLERSPLRVDLTRGEGEGR